MKALPQPSSPDSPSRPSLKEAFRFWLKLGFISFGGPAGQIAIMHTELVERRQWLSERRFLHALNFCMLLPGPEAQQLATYVGWLLHRTWGGLIAGTLFVLPSVVVLWLLGYIYMAYGEVAGVAAAFTGLKPAVLAVVAAAVLRIGHKALKNQTMWLIAAGAFVAIFFLKVPFPAIVFGAGALGWLGSKVSPHTFVTLAGREEEAGMTAGPDHLGEIPPPSWGRSLRVILIGLALWLTPVFLAGHYLGKTHSVTEEGVFFSKAAVMTFGGAYAVLPYVAQEAVEEKSWLEPEQMLDGLGLAESTPGPLIMVVQFVGFVGGWQNPEGLSPLLAATAGAALTTWVTFAPCFLWIFLGAPFIERLHGHAGITGALSTITAAVVGVILNLALWFGLHVLFPAGQGVQWFGLTIFGVTLFALIKWKVDVLWIVFSGCALGLLHYAFS
ncbi:chromate efflux transporter [Roseibacillus ishigakijimensis]|uniref:Chromate efflux transporter n=1 Tax=Roseibacillus ishigakijimensis TaxID=454146 RepID=A0A934RPM0_9BACT|nr:chromate efflux transporter [Roseibacillus ishigakijimensis]MBK1834638.1 chromate efflux transporter [Roseibacillus ishigakijimensis]